MKRICGLAAALRFGIILLTAAGPAVAQTAAEPPAGTQDTFMLTIFLRHDEAKTLGEIQQHLKETGFDKNFPPPGIEIVSWYVMMGIGQVVTLRVPPARLREVNRTDRAGRLGRVPHRVLSHLRLSAGVEGGASGPIAPQRARRGPR